LGGSADGPEMAVITSSAWLQIAAAHGGRPDKTPAWPPSNASDFSLLGDLEGVIDLDAEVTHGRLELRVSE
jgi:hypothetical protein